MTGRLTIGCNLTLSYFRSDSWIMKIVVSCDTDTSRSEREHGSREIYIVESRIVLTVCEDRRVCTAVKIRVRELARTI
jgi:hypothetical protein